MHEYMYTCTYTHVHMHIHAYIHTSSQVHMYTSTHPHIHTCSEVHMYICTTHRFSGSPSKESSTSILFIRHSKSLLHTSRVVIISYKTTEIQQASSTQTGVMSGLIQKKVIKTNYKGQSDSKIIYPRRSLTPLAQS